MIESPTPFDPSFLNESTPQPEQQQWSSDSWRVSWHQSVGQLSYLFLQPAKVERRARAQTKEYELFSSHTSLEGGELDITVKVSHGIGSAELIPTILLGYKGKTTKALKITLAWGQYNHTVETNDVKIVFDPVPLNAIGNSKLAEVAHPLTLTVETVP